MYEELTIVISKTQLLEHLKKHRERFVKSYNALLKAYGKRVVEYQAKYGDYAKKVVAKQLENKNDQEPTAPLEPEDRTKDYDFYIEMIIQHENAAIELSETLFKRLWNDQWDWTRSHYALLNFYAGGNADMAQMASAYSSGD